ncbi:mite allergen Der p 3-like isoform X2 [Tachypleus tridentatus]|uniref:mite allergen Der p 3-like isoform X2 n=1 Tax=Tachypleus tridentatus TaxID=6853 RepID=UPI003FD16366
MQVLYTISSLCTFLLLWCLYPTVSTKALQIRLLSESLVGRSTSFCGGILITDRHILTAGHCINGLSEREISFNVGDYDVSKTSERENVYRNATKIIQHPKFSSETYENDIAVIEMEKAVKLDPSKLKTVCLPPLNSDLSPGTPTSVIGWGRIGFYNTELPSVLQQVDVPVVSRKTCQIPLEHNISENMMCAGGKVGKDACLGDSGSGLMVKINNDYVLCGLVSFGKECARAGVAGVYTRVSRYIDWILQITKDASCSPYIVSVSDYPK